MKWWLEGRKEVEYKKADPGFGPYRPRLSEFVVLCLDRKLPNFSDVAVRESCATASIEARF